jgi:Domain of unknown function (DUF4390)
VLAPPVRGRLARRLAVVWLLLALLAALAMAPRTARAEAVALSTFSVERGEEGVLLSFVADFELPRSVEDALVRGVPLYFEAEASVLQSRWYWRDKRIARAARTWRVTYQPLTRQYRVGSGGLNQNFETLAEALDVVRRAARWKIAEGPQVEEEGRYYVEFRFRLDTSQLPRPMQLGIGSEASWELSVERSVRLN